MDRFQIGARLQLKEIGAETPGFLVDVYGVNGQNGE
jgi:hypothetical protein